MHTNEMLDLARPYIDRMALTADDMAEAYTGLRVSEFIVRFCLRTLVERSRTPASGGYIDVDMSQIVADVVAAIRRTRRFQCIAASSDLLNKTLSIDIQKTSLVVAANLAMYHYAQEDRFTEFRLIYKDEVAARGKFEILKSVSLIDMLQLMQVDTMPHVFPIINSMIEQIITVWDVLEQRPQYAAFARDLNVLAARSALSSNSNVVVRWCMTDGEIQLPGYDGIPEDMLPFAAFSNMFIGSQSGVFATRLATDLIGLLDKHLYLSGGLK